MSYDPKAVEYEKERVKRISSLFFNYTEKYREHFCFYTSSTLHLYPPLYNKTEEEYIRQSPLRQKIGVYLETFKKHITRDSQLLSEDEKGWLQTDLHLVAWINWLMDYALGRTWGDSRDGILSAINSFKASKIY